MQEQKLLDRVVELLRRRGYPDDSILIEPSSERGHVDWLVPDLLILDPRTRERLAAFEIKVNNSAVIPSLSAAWLETYTKMLQTTSLRLYFATAAPGPASELELYQLDARGELQQIAEAEFPTFRALAADKFAARKDRAREDQLGTTESFKLMTRWIALVALLLIAVDVLLEQTLQTQLLTPNRLVAFGVAAALLVVPYAAKFKALGVEWERFLDDR